MATECPICGAATLEKRSGNFKFKPPDNIPGGAIIVTEALWMECTTCNELIIPPALNKALDDEARARRGLLTPQEIKEVRVQTGLSQEDMAQLIGIGAKTYTRWESGRSIQNKSNDNLIRLVQRNAGLFAQLDAERNPARYQMVCEYVTGLQKLKGTSEIGMAAHGAELDPAMSKVLRRRLREIHEAVRNVETY